MPENAQHSSGLIMRIMNGAALAYLLFIAFYLVVRGLVGDGVARRLRRTQCYGWVMLTSRRRRGTSGDQ